MYMVTQIMNEENSSWQKIGPLKMSSISALNLWGRKFHELVADYLEILNFYSINFLCRMMHLINSASDFSLVASTHLIFAFISLISSSSSNCSVMSDFLMTFGADNARTFKIPWICLGFFFGLVGFPIWNFLGDYFNNSYWRHLHFSFSFPRL